MDEDDDSPDYNVYEDYEEEIIDEEEEEEPKINEIKNESDDEEDEIEDENEEYEQEEIKIKKNANIVKHKYLTKYEYCRITEALCHMISDKNFNLPKEIPENLIDPVDIAIYWLNNRKTIPYPLDIERHFFNEKNLIVSVSNLKSI